MGNSLLLFGAVSMTTFIGYKPIKPSQISKTLVGIVMFPVGISTYLGCAGSDQEGRREGTKGAKTDERKMRKRLIIKVKIPNFTLAGQPMNCFMKFLFICMYFVLIHI